MDEYIDLEAAFNAITDLAGKASTRSAYEAIWKSARALKKIPAADVAPMTRCKDCRYRGLICCPAVHETICNGLVDYAVDNGYCWRGKPKET